MSSPIEFQKAPTNADHPEGLQTFHVAPEKTQAAVEPHKPRGRPSEFDQAVFNEIIERIAAGQTLTAICEDTNEDGRMPSRMAFRRWMRNRPDLRAAYARAREDQVECWEDEIIDIAYDRSGDKICDSEGNEYEDKEFVNRSRVKIDSLKWIMSKVNSRKYGDKIEQNVTGNMTTSFTLNIGDGSVRDRQPKNVAGEPKRLTIDLTPKPAQEIIDENL